MPASTAWTNAAASLARVRRRYHDVGPLDGGGAGRDGGDAGLDGGVHLRGERLPVGLGRRVDVDPVELPDRRGRPELSLRLRTAPDHRERRDVLAGECVHAHRARRAGLERVDVCAVDNRERRARLGVELRRDEVGVAVAEPRGVGVPTHRARLGQDRDVRRQESRRVAARQGRAWLRRRARPDLPVALADGVDVLRGGREPTRLVAREKQRVCHGETCSPTGKKPRGSPRALPAATGATA